MFIHMIRKVATLYPQINGFLVVSEFPECVITSIELILAVAVIDHHVAVGVLAVPVDVDDKRRWHLHKIFRD